MNKTKIDWCDMSWNPVTGCLHGCDYCYARNQARRFEGADLHSTYGPNSTMKWRRADDPFAEPFNHAKLFDVSLPLHRITKQGKTIKAVYPFGFEPTLHRYRLDEPTKIKKSQNIFVCSMADLFGDWVPAAWIKEVFETCIAAPQHNYLFLTKNSKGYNAIELPNDDNFWYGTSVTVNAELTRIMDLPLRRKTFLSIEPILEKINLYIGGKLPMRPVDWIIVGAETGNRKTKIRPLRNWLEALVVFCKEQDIPLFMKGSLRETWGDDLIQEFPAGMNAHGLHPCDICHPKNRPNCTMESQKVCPITEAYIGDGGAE